MMIYGRVGQPSHRAIYLVSINVQKTTVITEKTNAPKPDTKTPKKQQVEINGERVPPDQGSGATPRRQKLDFCPSREIRT